MLHLFWKELKEKQMSRVVLCLLGFFAAATVAGLLLPRAVSFLLLAVGVILAVATVECRER